MIDLNSKKRKLGIFIQIFRNNGMCLNITDGFLQSCLLKNTINESRIGVNKKRCCECSMLLRLLRKQITILNILFTLTKTNSIPLLKAKPLSLTFSHTLFHISQSVTLSDICSDSSHITNIIYIYN